MPVHDVGSDSYVVEFRTVEGTPAFGKTLPFAGRRGNESLGRFNEDEGIIQPSGRRIDDGINQGCSRCSDEEGNLRPQPFCGSRRQGGEGPLLGATRPVQSSAIVQRAPPQAVVGSGRRPQAASRLGDGFQCRIPRRACIVVGRHWKGCLGSWLFLSFFERGRSSLPIKQEWRGGERTMAGYAREGAAALGNARIGCSRVCPCVGK